MNRIDSLSSLEDFFRALVQADPAIKAFQPIDNGEDGFEQVETYYERDYKGLTAFFQVAEGVRDRNDAGSERLTFLCSLTLAEKPHSTKHADRLAARDNTMRRMLRLLGRIEEASDESIEAMNDAEDGYTVELTVHRNSMLPISRMANAHLNGWYVDIDVAIPANHLLYTDPQ